MALYGVGSQMLIQMLEDYLELKRVKLCLDYDIPSMAEIEQIGVKLRERDTQM